MTPLGNNILVEPKPREKVLASGIIVPDTVENPKTEWGVVVEGNDNIKEGSQVLYFGKHCFEKDGKKLVSTKKILLCDDEPMFDNVLMSFVDEEDVSEGGIILSHGDKQRDRKARVVAVGDGVVDVEPGDEILCKRGTFVKVNINRIPYWISNEKNVLFVWKQAQV